MLTRRDFVRRTGGAALVSGWAPIVSSASSATAGRSAEDLAADEDFWREVQGSFTLDRTMINLNSGGVSPSPRVVHEAYKRYLEEFEGLRVTPNLFTTHAEVDAFVTAIERVLAAS